MNTTLTYEAALSIVHGWEGDEEPSAGVVADVFAALAGRAPTVYESADLWLACCLIA